MSKTTCDDAIKAAKRGSSDFYKYLSNNGPLPKLNVNSDYQCGELAIALAKGDTALLVKGMELGLFQGLYDYKDEKGQRVIHHLLTQKESGNDALGELRLRIYCERGGVVDNMPDATGKTPADMAKAFGPRTAALFQSQLEQQTFARDLGHGAFAAVRSGAQAVRAYVAQGGAFTDAIEPSTGKHIAHVAAGTDAETIATVRALAGAWVFKTETRDKMDRIPFHYTCLGSTENIIAKVDAFDKAGGYMADVTDRNWDRPSRLAYDAGGMKAEQHVQRVIYNQSMRQQQAASSANSSSITRARQQNGGQSASRPAPKRPTGRGLAP